ncbi:MAG: hypothetical protein DLM61_13620 [Pseudonocardiales bacterium]|nr:MAG: hypothetical protein DLM61_13620 [Pseudonocardiales bacterium]
MPSATSGTGVAGLDARHVSVSAVGNNPTPAEVVFPDAGPVAVVSVVRRASLTHHSAVATASTATTTTTAAVKSLRVRRSGAGIRPLA